MSRKVSLTFCKSKQIPRIFQRNQTVRSVVRNNWISPGLLNIDGNIATIQANSSTSFNLESCDRENKHYYDDGRKKFRDKVTSVDYTTEISNTTDPIGDVGSIELSKCNGELFLEKSAGTSDTVDDIEKWLKTRTESVSSIDLDAMKSVVEEEEKEQEEEVEDRSVGVDRYLADDLPHAFLCKDPDGLSIDIDLSDKKLNLDYDPLLRELRSDKLLEACEKNDDFIMPEFRLDQLDPLVLSPHDMMVAGEILPSGPPASPQQISKRSAIGRVENERSRDSELGEPADKPIQADYSSIAEPRELGREIREGRRPNEEYTESPDRRVIEPRNVENFEASSEIRDSSRGRNKAEPRIAKKRRRIGSGSDGGDITFLGEPCHIDGKDSVMAVVAISTDKISNMTQIVINTGMDEQIYQGKTSELIEATGNFQKITNIDIDAGAFPARDRPHERMVTKALEELGITDESLEPALINESGRTWLCPRDECNREFCKLHALKAHLLAHFGIRPFKCDYEGCTWAFHSEFKLKRHKETHLKRKNFACEVAGCNRRFTTVYNLWSHEKLHTRPNRVTCQVPDCHEKFQTKRALELHMRNHDQSHAPYRCSHESCGKRYYTSNALMSHQRCHNYKDIDIKCSWPECGKIFDKPCRLKAHVRSHTGSKPYGCTYRDCKWAFTSSSKLKRHQKKHTNERKFVCSVDACGKAFMRSEHLKEHLLTHAGGGYFQCHTCDAHFSAKSSLYVHTKKHQGSKDQADRIIDGNEKILKRRYDAECRETRKNFIVESANEIAGSDEKFDADSMIREEASRDTESLGTRSVRVGRKNVKKERKSCSYNCGMEGCGKSYRTLSILAGHMVETHGSSMIDDDDESPIGISNVTEASDLDYILYATPSTNSNGTCRAMMLESCDAIIVSESPRKVARLPEPEPPPQPSPPLPLPSSSPSPPTIVDKNTIIAENSRRTFVDKQIFDNAKGFVRTCRGSARTGLTREDVWKLKGKISDTEITNVGATDVVLGEANLNEGLLLTEELPSMYYQDDNIVGTECQILLLDTGSSETPIDLRGIH